MRRLGYGALALLLLAVLLPVLHGGWRQWQAWRNLAPARNAGLDERVLFEARNGRALAFNTATHQGWFALQGFVVADTAQRVRGLPVSVEVALLGAGGRPVERVVRHLALGPAQQVRAYGLLDGHADAPVWILPTEWIDLSARGQVRTVRVRVVDSGPGVRQVLWRGAIDQRLSDTQMRLRYRRLGDAARDALTSGWITPAALVPPLLKQELLRYRQQRVGPLGQAGEAFVARRVLRQPPLRTPRRFDPRLGAMPIAPGLHVSLRLPAARTVEVDARDAAGAPLAVEVRGPGVPTRAGLDGRARLPWAAGRYELRSDTAGTVEVRDADTGDRLLPDGRRPRAHRAAPGATLRYAVEPLQGVAPPVRVQVRSATVGRPARAELRFLDAAGRPLAVQALQAGSAASAYDRLTRRLDRAAAEPARVEVQPPSGATVLDVHADAPVWVTAYTTLPDARAGRGRAWFAFLPETASARAVTVVEQPRATGTRSTLAFARAAPVAALPRPEGASAPASTERGTRARARPDAPRETSVRPRLRLRRAGGREGDDDASD